MKVGKRLTLFDVASTCHHAAHLPGRDRAVRSHYSEGAPLAPNGTVPKRFRTATPPTRLSILSEAPLG